eukprot:114498_1
MRIDNVPKDHGYFVYWICLLLGCGTLLAYNLLITCADYFNAEFPNHNDIMFYIVPASAFTQLLFLVLMILYGHKFSFTTRIVSSFLLSSIALGILPIVVHHLSQTAGFWIVLAISAFIGITTAVLQASVIGFCNYLPSSYIQLSFAGQAMSGITACIIRIITKLYDIYGGITAEQGGIVYFVTGAAFDIVCAISFIFVFKTIFTQYWLKTKTHDEEVDALLESIPSIETQISSDTHDGSLIGAVASGDNKTPNVFPKPKPLHEKHASYKTVFNKIWRIALAVFLVFYVTLLAFPGLLVGIKSQYSVIEKNAWMPVILTTEYNCGDWAGRQFLVSWLRKVKWDQNLLWKACLLRFILYPIFIILFLGYWRYDIIAYIATAVLSLSNGYFCCICFVEVPLLVKHNEQQICGAIMSFSLVLGITLGSYTALALSPLI